MSGASSASPVRKRGTSLRLGGLTPLSATDYPGALSAVLFAQGCGWRCRYCHNAHLMPAGPGELSWGDALAFLKRRAGLLDAAVFSGGEPTLQEGLAEAMREVRALGFRVGLHSGGLAPERLAAVLPLADWVGFDAKAPWARYAEVTGLPGSGVAARESLGLLISSGVDHECRVTAHPDLFTAEELAAFAGELYARGAKSVVLQAFRAEGCRDAALNALGAGAAEALLRAAAALEPRLGLRGL